MEVHQFKIASRQTTDVDDLRSLYQISDENLERIREFGECATPVLQEIIDKWYGWLETQPGSSQ